MRAYESLRVELKETFSWLKYAQVRGFVMYGTLNGVENRLPGMLTVNLGDSGKSLDEELKRYIGDTFVTVTKNDDKSLKITKTPWISYFTQPDVDEVRSLVFAQISAP